MHDLIDPGAILLRAGRPVLVVPDTVPPLDLHRAVVAWKDTRECRRAIHDAIPLLQHAREVLLLEVGEEDGKSEAKKVLADVTRYLVRHKVAGGRKKSGDAPGRRRLPKSCRSCRDEKADLIVAGGYGHSRLGEWIFGGVTHELLAQKPGVLPALALTSCLRRAARVRLADSTDATRKVCSSPSSSRIDTYSPGENACTPKR